MLIPKPNVTVQEGKNGAGCDPVQVGSMQSVSLKQGGPFLSQPLREPGAGEQPLPPALPAGAPRGADSTSHGASACRALITLGLWMEHLTSSEYSKADN